MAQSSQHASRSGDLLSHMFVLGKKTVDSVNCLISGTLGTSAAFSAGAWEIFFFPKAFGAAWALPLDQSAGQCKLWLGWRCRATDWDLGKSSLLHAAAAPQPAPGQKSKSLLTGTTECRHAQELLETRRWVSWVFGPIQESWGLPRPGMVPASRKGGRPGGNPGWGSH